MNLLGVTQFNVGDLPVAANVCEQVLREVEKQPTWSMAHVIMNPMASSLLHSHQQMTEIYVITKGFGNLAVWDEGDYDSGRMFPVVAGSVYVIPTGDPHQLFNESAGHLEHLVFALPPFDSSDVALLEKERHFMTRKLPFPSLLTVQDCFDGARILPYSFFDLGLSITFGWTINDLSRHKRPHFHKKTTEFVYVVEGKGVVEVRAVPQPIRPGDWIRINPETDHVLRNESPEDLVVVCICSPAFQVKDTYFRLP